MSHPTEAAYCPPQPAFAVCPRCGGLCLRGQDGSLLTPALGLPHAQECNLPREEGKRHE